mgnify:CR=1 FL=1
MLLELRRELNHNFFDSFRIKSLFNEWFPNSKFLSIYIYPPGIGIFMYMVFLTDNVADEKTFSHFCFFYTIYAFWVGLFSSCQSINGKLENGEWSYWVLGCRRPYYKIIIASLISSILVSFLQVLFFALTVIICDYCLGGKILYDVLAKTSCCRLFKYEFFKSYYSIFLYALIVSCISGVGFGLLFSCLLKNTVTSLRISVVFIVLVLISSKIIVNSNDCVGFLQFEPIYILNSTYVHVPHKKGEECHKIKTFSEIKGLYSENFKSDIYKAIVSDISFLFPQRYFFNIATVFHKNAYVYQHCTLEDIKIHSTRSIRCVCGECINDKRLTYAYNDYKYYIKLETDEMDRINNYLKYRDKLRIKGARGFIFNILSWESAVLFLFFVLNIIFSIVLVYGSKKYYYLR